MKVCGREKEYKGAVVGLLGGKKLQSKHGESLKSRISATVC